MNKLLMTFIIGLFIISFTAAGTSYTTSTETNCNGNICSKTIYSGTRFVEEDKQWKKVEDAKSLMGKGFEVVVMENDEEFPVEVIDFNSTSITVKLNPKGVKIFEENVPIRLWKNNETKAEKYYEDVKDGKKVKKAKDKEYKEKMDKVKDEEIGFWLLNQEETRTYDFGIGDVLEFGYNSTTIILQDADTENLEDADTDSSNPNRCGGAETQLSFPNNIFIKFNISSMYDTGYDTILNVDLMLWGFFSGTIRNATTNLVYENFTVDGISWVEGSSTNPCLVTGGITFNDHPIVGEFNTNLNTSTPINPVTQDQQFIPFNNTDNFNFSLSEMDTTFSLWAKLIGSQDGYSIFSSKEDAIPSRRPYLNITYLVNLAINITNPLNQSYTTPPSTLNWTVGGEEEEACWWSDDNGGSNTTVTCGDLTTPISYNEGDAKTIIMWTNDSGSNEVSSNVTFSINITNPQVELIFPTATNYTTSVTQLNFSVSDVNGLEACWYSTNTTVNVTTSCSLNITGLLAAQGENNWTVYANDSSGNENESSVTFNVDTILPVLNILTPDKAFNFFGRDSDSSVTVPLNWSVTDTNLEACWYSTNNSVNKTVTCGNNATLTLDYGKYTFRVYANDTLGNLGTDSFFVEYGALVNISETFDASVFETQYKTFLLNFTYPSSNFTAVARLVYDTDTITVGTLTGSGDNLLANVTFDIPEVGPTENRPFYWNISLTNATATYNYTIKDNLQETKNITFTICDDDFSIVYLNYTFKDEDNDALIQASVDSGIFNYWLGNADVTKQYIFSNSTLNSEYNFCFGPENLTVHNTINLVYSNNNSGYGQRVQISSDDLTNTTTSTVLFLLGTGGSTLSSIFVTSGFGNSIEGVAVKLERQINGVWTQVGQDSTDSAGIASFFINLNFDYRYTLTHADYITEIFTIRPTQSLYIVTMTSVTTETIDTSEGMIITTLPQGTFLDVNTVYDFIYIINSSSLDLEEYGFELLHKNGTSITSDSDTTAGGGSFTKSFNTTNLTKIIMNYYYIADSTRINGTTYWLISESNDFSLTFLFTRITTYINADIFGINSNDGGYFAKAMISILVLIMTTGILSSRYGLQSEAAITGLIFGVTFMLNMFNLIPTPDFLTFINLGDFIVFLVAIFSISIIIKEERF